MRRTYKRAVHSIFRPLERIIGGKALNSELEALETALAKEPARLDLAARMVQVLSALGRDVPLELERQALEDALTRDSTRVDLVARMAQVLSTLGRDVPFELEMRALCHATAQKAAADAESFNASAATSKPVPEVMSQLFDQQPSHPRLSHFAYSQLKKEKAGFKSIAFITLPKSGTVFLMNWLSAQSKLPLRAAGNSYFPEDDISLDRIMAVAVQPAVLFGHHHASARNLDTLAWLTGKVTVQIRDPRSCLLSWLHHLARIHEERPWSLHQVAPAPDDAFFAMDQGGRLNWLIENFYPAVIQWIVDWVTAADSCRRPHIQLKTFERFRSDPYGWMTETMAFHGLPGEPVKMALLPEKANAHFRAGHSEGWRTGLPKEIAEKCTSMIPVSLADRFGWSLKL